MKELDNDRSYLRPRAWWKAKQAFGAGGGTEGGNDVGRALLGLESFARRSGWNVRVALAVAIHAFLSLAPQEKKQALLAWFDGNGRDRDRPTGSPMPEQLSEAERNALRPDFEQAIEKLFGDDS